MGQDGNWKHFLGLDDPRWTVPAGRTDRQQQPDRQQTKPKPKKRKGSATNAWLKQTAAQSLMYGERRN